MEAELAAAHPTPGVIHRYARILLWSSYDDIRDPERALVVAQRDAELHGCESPWAVAQLARAYRANNRLDEAAQAYRQALRALPPGPSEDRTAYQLSLADLLTRTGDHDAAAEITESLVEGTRAAHGDEQGQLVDRMIRLWWAARILDVTAIESKPILWLARSSHVTPIESRHILRAQRGLRPDENGFMPLGNYEVSLPARTVEPASALLRENQHADAESLLRAALAAYELVLSEEHWQMCELRSLLGAALTGQERFEEAEELLLNACEQMRADSEAPPESIATAIKRIVALYDASDRPDEAGEWRATLNTLDTGTGDENISETPSSKEDTP
jgi:tetratricopeptide (TPR) repeat protein